MTATVRVFQPHVLGKQQVVDFALAVMRGGEIASDGIERRIREAAWLGVVELDGTPVGVGALKLPRPNHRQEISEITGVDLSDYKYELGWIVISPQARGQRLSRLLVDALLAKADQSRVYVTVRADNTAIQIACAGYGFVDTGRRWQGINGILGLGLWEPDDGRQLALAI